MLLNFFEIPLKTLPLILSQFHFSSLIQSSHNIFESCLTNLLHFSLFQNLSLAFQLLLTMQFQHLHHFISFARVSLCSFHQGFNFPAIEFFSAEQVVTFIVFCWTISHFAFRTRVFRRRVLTDNAFHTLLLRNLCKESELLLFVFVLLWRRTFQLLNQLLLDYFVLLCLGLLVCLL